MSPEERELLTTSIKLAEENNKLLRGMRRSARFSSFLRAIYWLIILVTAFGTYYLVKPFIDPMISGYKSMQEGFNNIKSIQAKLPSLPSWIGGKE